MYHNKGTSWYKMIQWKVLIYIDVNHVTMKRHVIVNFLDIYYLENIK